LSVTHFHDTPDQFEIYVSPHLVATSSVHHSKFDMESTAMTCFGRSVCPSEADGIACQYASNRIQRF
jgi:hypothetical protein